MATEPINLVLFGRVRNGKSALGNAITRKTKLKDGKIVGVFESKSAASGVTTECKMETTTLEDGQVVNVIDTPGIFDPAISAALLRQEIIKCMHLAKEGIHGFILEEKCAIKYLQDFFGDKITEYMIIVFTGGDELEEDMTLEDYWGQDCPQALKDVMGLCKDRVVVFDNKTKDQKIRAKQVHQLMPLVKMVLAQNNGKPFTNEIFQELKRQDLKLETSQYVDIDKLVNINTTMTFITPSHASRKMKGDLEHSLSDNMEYIESCIRVFGG
ncbi:hypothetical protein MKX03_037565 [Papaver bracteatum]|nr:hypothetical protein MKX03_037565 [Papaver bracteatum]